MKFQPTEKAWMKSTLYGLEFKLVEIEELIEGESDESMYRVNCGYYSKPGVPVSTLFKLDAIEQVMIQYDDAIEQLKEAKSRQFKLMSEQLRA